MEGVTLPEIGIYLSISVAFLGAAWIVVKAGGAQVQRLLAGHISQEEITLSRIEASVMAATAANAALATRVTSIEARMSEHPTHEDVYRIGLGVERLIARLDSQDKIIARLDTITQRQEDYLLSRSR
jgi:hypothetical protein